MSSSLTFGFRFTKNLNKKLNVILNFYQYNSNFRKPAFNHFLRSYYKSSAETDFDQVSSGYRNQRYNDYNANSYTRKRNFGPQSVTDEGEFYKIDESEFNSDALFRKHRQEVQQQINVTNSKSFSDFPINSKLKHRLKELGYTSPFPVQTETLIHTLSGEDVIGRAVTGSGKTLAFAIPIVQKIQESQRSGLKDPRAIVISPTRELCLQIHRSVAELDPQIACVPIYGGDSINKQLRNMRNGVDVVCATPGRLGDFLENGHLSLDSLLLLCLDEADELLNPNFKMQIENVLQKTAHKRQVMLFSATMPADIRRIGESYMDNPKFIDITQSDSFKQAVPDNIRHLAISIPANRPLLVIQSLLEKYESERCILFVDTKRQANEIYEAFYRLNNKFKCAAIHSDISQSRRENIMSAFRHGLVKVLIATDVAARGLDVPEVDLVIQLGIPKNGIDFYVHRSGRTGRGGRKGLAILLHNDTFEDRKFIRDMKQLVKIEHETAPNQQSLQLSAAKKMLERISTMPVKDSDAILSLIEEFNISDESHCKKLLASALSFIVNGSVLRDSTDTFNTKSNTLTDRYKSPNYKSSGNRNLNRDRTYRKYNTDYYKGTKRYSNYQ